MDDRPNNSITLHPAVEALISELEKLRTEISMLLLERDHLRLQECKFIEMRYLVTIGALEYKVYELECEILRQKRKVELIQASKNRQEEANLSGIEEILEREFAEFQKQLAEQVGKLTAALEQSRGEPLNEADTREIKRLYRIVMKALHPDLHQHQSEEQLRLFHLAVHAHERADLESLRAIHIIAVNPDVGTTNLKKTDELTEERDRLKQTLGKLQMDITEIKSTYPYILKPIVESRERTEARMSELNAHIDSLNEVLETHKQRIATLLGL